VPARQTPDIAILERRIVVLTLACMVLLLQALATCSAEPEKPDAEVTQSEAEAPLELTREWIQLYRPQRAVVGIKPIPDDTPLNPLVGFTLEGTKPDHPFLLGKFTSSGEWGISRGLLYPVRGSDTALHLARVGDFEFEADVVPGGLGGWFILMGWDQGHGYGIYNVQMKESGSPWFSCEFRDSKALEETHGVISRAAWTKPDRLELVVKENLVSLKIGKETLVKDLELPNYHAGDLIIGTYDTKYGPKRLQIRSARIRAPQ
jgi:hypothetical protein